MRVQLIVIQICVCELSSLARLNLYQKFGLLPHRKYLLINPVFTLFTELEIEVVEELRKYQANFVISGKMLARCGTYISALHLRHVSAYACIRAIREWLKSEFVVVQVWSTLWFV